LSGAFLTSPPFDDDVIVMLATGWDWPTLERTPQRVVEQVMLMHKIQAEYQEKKRQQESQNG
jgi:hypothetical protein